MRNHVRVKLNFKRLYFGKPKAKVLRLQLYTFLNNMFNVVAIKNSIDAGLTILSTNKLVLWNVAACFALREYEMYMLRGPAN